jgi:ATP-dependent helicase/nuclease subunit B
MERIFLDWQQPLLPQAAACIIDRYADGDSLDLSQVILVFPGRRASRRMLELLLQQAGGRYPAWIPPRLVTFDRFPELLYPQKLALADDITQLLVWRQALQSIPESEIHAALPHLPPADAFTAWMSLCDTLRKQHNELAAEGMEFDEVVSALERFGMQAESERWTSLRRIQAEYLVQMDALSLWDRQAARIIAVEQQECRTDADILLVGTVDMNRIVRKMLDQVSDRVTALVHAPAALASSFDEHGCVNPAEWSEQRTDLPLARCRIVDTPADQAAEAIRLIRDRQSDLSADNLVIGVADEGLVPVLLQALSDSGVSGRWPVGMQVRETRPYRLLQAVAAHLASARNGTSPQFSTLMDLVRHPDIFDHINAHAFDGSSQIDWLSALDRYRADTLQMSPAPLPGSGDRRQIVTAVLETTRHLLGHLAASGSDSSVAATESQAETPRRKQKLLNFEGEASATAAATSLLSRRSLTAWTDGILRLLAAVYEDRQLTDSDSDQGIASCVNQLQETIGQLRGVPAAVLPRCTASQAIQFLLSLIADQGVPAAEDEQAIDLLGWLDLAQDDSRCLILTGFNEGNVPQSVTSDVFLPNTLREQVGLTDNRRRYARDAYAMSAIMHSCPDVMLIAGRVDHQNNPLTPSRLFFAAEPASLPQRVRMFYAPEEIDSAPNTTPASDEAPAVPSTTDTADVSGFTIPPIPADQPAPAEIPVSWFRDYLYCPYRYALNRELKLRYVEDEVLELNAAAFGSLLHTVLSRFADSAYRHATEPEAIRDYLRRELGRIATERFGTMRSATVNVQLSMAEARLDAFAFWQADTAAAGWRIQHSEIDLRYDDFTDTKDRPICLAGRIDRIDRLKDSNHWRVLDYKTSEQAEKPERAHRTRDGDWIDLQLPLYRLLSRSLQLKGDVELGYVHLPGDVTSVGLSLADWSDEDLAAAEQAARQVATQIMDLRIDRIAPPQQRRATEFARICQDTVVNPSAPWLSAWKGREVSQ